MIAWPFGLGWKTRLTVSGISHASESVNPRRCRNTVVVPLLAVEALMMRGALPSAGGGPTFNTSKIPSSTPLTHDGWIFKVDRTIREISPSKVPSAMMLLGSEAACWTATDWAVDCGSDVKRRPVDATGKGGAGNPVLRLAFHGRLGFFVSRSKKRSSSRSAAGSVTPN